jgi:sarcosine oxidase, subunit beta
MTRVATYDAIVIGGGVMGCAAALRLAEAGMRVILVEAATLGGGASGANAGTLSLQIKRLALIPYALRGLERWQALGSRVGYRKTGGLTLAFTQDEAALLAERMALKQAAGAPVTMLARSAIAAHEPGVSNAVVAASWCAEDGYADSTKTGLTYRSLLQAAGADIAENQPVQQIDENGGWTVVADALRVHAPRLLMAAGAWTVPLAKQIGLDPDIRVRVNTVTVTERMPPIVATVVGHATGLLTLKQKPNGTVLIGGGWQGRGSPGTGGTIDQANLITNLQLATHAVPALRTARALRSWTGFEAHTPDFMPLAGEISGRPGLFMLAAVRGGYTIGPYIGELMGDAMLGRQVELPLYDPSRTFEAAA